MTPRAVFHRKELPPRGRLGAMVLEMTSAPRTSREEWEQDLKNQGFSKALAFIKSMNGCSVEETRTAIENWYACGTFCADERAWLYEFYGWECPI